MYWVQFSSQLACQLSWQRAAPVSQRSWVQIPYGPDLFQVLFSTTRFFTAVQIYEFHISKIIMVQACLNIRKLELMCKISGFVQEIISAKYLYHGRSYCKTRTLGTICPIFVVIHRSSPESVGRDNLLMFSPFVYCIQSQLLSVSVCPKGWKYV